MAIAFLKEIARKNGKGVKDFTPAALETLMNYAWPENMRELRSAVESAIAVCESERIDLNDLPLHVRLLSSSTHQRPSNQAR
jgi:two-component system NtrC family response regulator